MKIDKKKHFIKFAVQTVAVILCVYVDYVLKNIAADKLADGKIHVFIKGFLGFVYAENTGAAFSMFTSSTTALSVVTGIVMAAGLIYLAIPSKRSLAYDICIPLIIAGGAGNLVDRIIRGYVIDYIDALFIDFPIFNFADCLITCGAFVLIIYLIYEIIKEGKDKKRIVNTEAVKADGESDE